jgi:hypothetical protein
MGSEVGVYFSTTCSVQLPVDIGMEINFAN